MKNNGNGRTTDNKIFSFPCPRSVIKKLANVGHSVVELKKNLIHLSIPPPQLIFEPWSCLNSLWCCVTILEGMSKMTPVPSHLLSEAEQRGKNGWANFHYNSALVLGGIRLWGFRFGEMNIEMVSQWISEWTGIYTPLTLTLCFRLTITCCWMCVALRIKPQHVHRYLEPVAAAGMFWPQHTNCPFICIYL